VNSTTKETLETLERSRSTQLTLTVPLHPQTVNTKVFKATIFASGGLFSLGVASTAPPLLTDTVPNRCNSPDVRRLVSQVSDVWKVGNKPDKGGSVPMARCVQFQMQLAESLH
jgi:hypothetical protein